MSDERVLLLLTVFYLGSWTTSAAVQNTSWERHSEAGVELRQQGLYANAEEEFLGQRQLTTQVMVHSSVCTGSRPVGVVHDT